MLRTLARIAGLAILLALAGILVWQGGESAPNLPPTMNAAAVFGVDTVTPEGLIASYRGATTTEQRIRVFVMPGHEPEYGGAEYRDLRERDMNVEVAEHLAAYLEADPHYEVALGRDKDGWNPELKAYFDENRDGIVAWRTEQQKIMKSLVREGSFSPKEDPIPHQAATGDVALRLYGINKWVAEQDFDIAIHIHFNDYGSRRYNRPGQITGFVVYVPDKQYSNSAAARMIAESVSERLSLFVAQSDAPKERGGVVEDQDLIALGSNNTADVPAMLIEYGYIYEDQFQDPAVRAALLKEYAYQTYLGLEDFFQTNDDEVPSYRTGILPYPWERNRDRGYAQTTDVLALQFALVNRGLYPPEGKTLRECPISGIFGECTALSLKAFQKRYEVQGEDGVFGLKTRNLLESLF